MTLKAWGVEVTPGRSTRDEAIADYLNAHPTGVPMTLPEWWGQWTVTNYPEGSVIEVSTELGEGGARLHNGRWLPIVDMEYEAMALDNRAKRLRNEADYYEKQAQQLRRPGD